MPDYSKMHAKLFNSTTDAIAILQKAQQDTEEIFITSPEPSIHILKQHKSEDEPSQKE